MKQFTNVAWLSLFAGALLVIALLASCKKSESDQAASSRDASPSYKNPVAASNAGTIHWLGKKRLAAESNAAFVVKVWSLPESGRLQAQTLDKLALFLASTNHPSRINSRLPPITNYAALAAEGPAALIRPLLEDLVQEESYCELRGPTNQPGELVLAIKLDPLRASVWDTNLAGVLQSVTGGKVTRASDIRGWRCAWNGQKQTVQFSRAPEWILVGLSREGNGLLGDVAKRIENQRVPFAAPTTNFWVEVERVDPGQLLGTLGIRSSLPENLPNVFLSIIGDGENVRTRGHLDFPKPLNLQLEPWNIPTNLISQPLVSFTAIRGFGPWLSALKAWKDLNIGEPPNQFYSWGVHGLMMLSYFAAPHPNASNLVSRLTDLILKKGESYFATNTAAKFERSATQGLEWKGVPIMTPFVEALHTNGGVLFGGWFPAAATNEPPPSDLLEQVVGPTNLIMYDWEITGPRSEQLHYTGQFVRMVTFHDQMGPEIASRQWLKAVTLGLGNCGSTVTTTASTQVSFVRKSAVGLTALELQVLADWLESPDFPYGLHSLTLAPAVLIPEKADAGSQGAEPRPK